MFIACGKALELARIGFYAMCAQMQKMVIEKWFWRDTWYGDHSLKVLFFDLFTCSTTIDASVCSVMISQTDGEMRSQNVSFQRDFNDQELDTVNAFLYLLYSNTPRREVCDRLSWRLKGGGKFNVCFYYDALWVTCLVFFP